MPHSDKVELINKRIERIENYINEKVRSELQSLNQTPIDDIEQAKNIDGFVSTGYISEWITNDLSVSDSPSQPPLPNTDDEIFSIMKQTIYCIEAELHHLVWLMDTKNKDRLIQTNDGKLLGRVTELYTTINHLKNLENK